MVTTCALRCRRTLLTSFTSQIRNFSSTRSSSTTTASTSTIAKTGAAERLRVAVVGGGCAGLSSALHLAPLVEQGLIASPIDVFDAGSGTRSSSRDIGVGIWSTALDPFKQSDRESHELVYQEMTTLGTYVGDVGYRIPNGKWLMKSRLPTTEEEMLQRNMPALLFLRERDMLLSLQKACHLESHKGTIKVHRDGDKTRVQAVNEKSTKSWSSELIFSHNRQSERDYHLIIAADGTHSTLRSRYGGYDNITPRLIGSSGLPTPIELPQKPALADASMWDFERQKEAVGIQDRGYTVFRGNSTISKEQAGQFSFQTWGEGNSMRFATVPLLYPASQGTHVEKQVWFITIDNEEIASNPDPIERRSFLLDEFRDWHEPIKQIVENTPPHEILAERAVAHRHTMGPVMSTNTVIQKITGQRPASSGEGPCIVFVGDAYMTVDPILAQGFTCAMEGAAALRGPLERGCKMFKNDPTFAFDPLALRNELKYRHHDRMDRIVSVLRATELVQALGQPQGSSVSGFFNKRIVRPITRMIPNSIKAPIFDSVLKYSLGLPLTK